LKNGVVIAINKNRQIIRIDGNKTSREITIATSTINDVITAYGNNYYKRITDQGMSVIGYVDQQRRVTIEFGYYPQSPIPDSISSIRYDITSME
jgi:hypothetical protein